MPPTFREQAETDMEDVFLNTAEFAVEVTYTPHSGGTPVVRNFGFSEFVGTLDDKQSAIFLCSDDATLGVASPSRYDTFIITGESTVWTVMDVRSDRAGGHELRVVAPLAIT